MSRVDEKAPCWVIRDGAGDPWNDDRDVHHDSREDAEQEITEIREEEAEGLTAEDDAKQFAEGFPPGPERDQRYARALASRQRHNARVASLHAVELPEVCYQVRCDGGHDGCEDEPYSDDYAHIHFSGRYPFEAGEFEWLTVDGRDYCEECGASLLCVECGELIGAEGDQSERMCAACVAADAAKPGPADVPKVGGVA